MASAGVIAPSLESLDAVNATAQVGGLAARDVDANPPHAFRCRPNRAIKHLYCCDWQEPVES